MQPKAFYDAKPNNRRRLEDGDGIRNTHNFLKACLINEFVPKGSHVLDLGCGCAQDILKLKRRNPKSYRGIDISTSAIESASMRIARSGLDCRVSLETFDFREHNWVEQESLIDVVSAQFSLHFAYSSEKCANHVISSISRVLKPGGHFIGTIPVHDSQSYTTVVVKLPGYDRECEESCASRDDVVKMCRKHGLKCISWILFQYYYEQCAKAYPDMLDSMRGHANPDPKNAVFVFTKTPFQSNV